MQAREVSSGEQIFWSRKKTAQMLDISIATLDRINKRDSTFPPKIRLAKRKAGWRADSIKKWLEGQS